MDLRRGGLAGLAGPQGGFRFHEAAGPGPNPFTAGRGARPLGIVEHLGGDLALGNGGEVIAVPLVQHMHCGRVAVLHFTRIQVQGVVEPVDIHKDLRGMGDGRRRVEGMVVPDQDVVRDGVQRE